MARFIEVAPFNYGAGKKKMLINVEKIDYVQEDNEDVPMVELLEGDSVEFAIIGNIWENPELLEVRT